MLLLLMRVEDTNNQYKSMERHITHATFNDLTLNNDFMIHISDL